MEIKPTPDESSANPLSAPMNGVDLAPRCFRSRSLRRAATSGVSMERIALKPLLLAAGLLAFMPMAQAASTLVYCSEASPAGFDPSQYTSGTDFDASAETVFNRLTQFKRGGTEVEARSGDKLGCIQRWPDLYLPPARWRQVPHHQSSSRLPAISTRMTCCSPSTACWMPAVRFGKAYPSASPHFTDMGLNTHDQGSRQTRQTSCVST